MIVPQYWAEGRVQHREKGRQVTIRRFGWSDLSQEEAQSMADQRAQEALRRVLSGESLARREFKMPYNGADGLPIREEIVSRHGESVITRNSYGALCLNTPNVLFADIDFEQGAPAEYYWAIFAVLFGAAFIYGRGNLSIKMIAVYAVLAGLIASFLARFVFSIVQRFQEGPEAVALKRVRAFLRAHPDWNVRIYRTPAGLRVLALHRTFSPSEPAVAECFKAFGADRIYVRMCQNQQCFRARLTPKPWRIGVEDHLRPRPGIWPVKPEQLPRRQEWVARYEAAARQFSACQFVETIGSGAIHPDAGAVLKVHDELSQANSGLPTA